MTRFRDGRPIVYKRTPAADEARYSAATPLRLSPFKPDGVSVREGMNAADILRAGHNRRSRRSLGLVRPRRRIGGVALITKPWQPVVEDVAA